MAEKTPTQVGISKEDLIDVLKAVRAPNEIEARKLAELEALDQKKQRDKALLLQMEKMEKDRIERTQKNCYGPHRRADKSLRMVPVWVEPDGPEYLICLGCEKQIWSNSPDPAERAMFAELRPQLGTRVDVQ